MFNQKEFKSKPRLGVRVWAARLAFGSGAVSRGVLTCVVALALLSGCLSGPERGVSNKGEGVMVALQIETGVLAKGGLHQFSNNAAWGLSMRPLDSAHVIVTGPEMDTLYFGFLLDGSAQSLSLSDVPPGADRRFDIRLNRLGRVLYTGSVTTTLHTDRVNAFSVVCAPEFSRLNASIHIPLDFPKTVSGGVLRLWNGSDTLSAPATTNGELRNFRLEEVPGDQTYSVTLALWGPTGDTIATAFRSDVTVPKGQNVALVMPLTLAYTQIVLTMTVSDPRSTTLVLSLPGGKRTPSSFGEAVFSELYPVPSAEDGGDSGEWLELFNRVTDTLDVSGCQLIRDAGTGTGMNFTLPVNTLIPPGRGLVVGRSGVSFAQVSQASALTLTNTSARLEFACAQGPSGALRLDTLRYTTTLSDTLAARISNGKVTSLRPSRLHLRGKSDSWCLTAPTAAIAVFGESVATPGSIVGGCGE
jgi:hypothetical protein